MKRKQPLTKAVWPDPMWMTIVAFSALVLCSCRGPMTRQKADYPMPAGEAFYPQAMSDPMGTQPDVAMVGAPGGPWAPPGTSQPWPQDEYLRDGGDRRLAATVGKHWQVHGLDLEDTIAHYDTIDGQTLVEASNRVHIYSPRFGAVRKVSTVLAHDQSRQTSGVYQPEKLFGPTTVQPIASSKQNLQANRQVGRKLVDMQGRWQGGGVLSSQERTKAFQDRFSAYENLAIIRTGFFDAAEMATLARSSKAAIAWTHEQAVQVVIDHQAAMAESSDQTVESLFVFKTPPGNPKLRVLKVASRQFAKPGEEVDFTIRFDNIGNQVIGNVTIIDNLTTRLEYVADSAQCTLDAKFLTEPNEGGSLVLRCEITDPLKQGEGGVIRFRCRVR
jgi:uncharacterized repeat protein (TIGR01451 family)